MTHPRGYAAGAVRGGPRVGPVGLWSDRVVPRLTDVDDTTVLLTTPALPAGHAKRGGEAATHASLDGPMTP